MASYRLEFTWPAARDLRRLDRLVLARVIAAIEALGAEPRPPHVKKLVGSEHTYRIRVGNYRGVYTIEDRGLLVLVQRIRHRGDVYR